LLSNDVSYFQGCCVTDRVSDFIEPLFEPGKEVDIIHGSLPTEAEYARIVRRELGEESGNLYEQIYELAKEIQPKFLFFELRETKLRRSNSLTPFIHRISELSYDCRWDTLSAYDVGSPQKRERVYLLARKREGTEKALIQNTNSGGGLYRESFTNSILTGQSQITKFPYVGTVKRTPERLAEVKAGLDEVCVPQYREAFLRLMGLK
jgi:site-specific DNA-cytosine methylase